MARKYNLSETVAPGDTNHATLHNQERQAVNDLDDRVVAVEGGGNAISKSGVIDTLIAAGARQYRNIFIDPIPVTGAPYSNFPGAGGAAASGVTAGSYYSMKWTTASPTASGGASVGGKTASRLIPTAGTPLYVSGEVWLARPQSMYISTEWYTSANSRISQEFSSTTSVSASTWTKLSTTTAVAPSNASYAVISFYANPASGTPWAVNDELRLRSVLVSISSTAVPFFSGASANARWDGLPNESASTGVTLT